MSAADSALMAQYLLGFFVLPLWIAAGFADYLCHRAARIEQNSGISESILHLLQFALMAIPVTMVLLLEVNGGVILTALLCVLLHHAAAYIDVMYADGARKIPPREQMIHSLLEVLPIAAMLLLIVAHPQQSGALIGISGIGADFTFRLGNLPRSYVMSMIGVTILLNALPYGEEFLRCLRQRN